METRADIPILLFNSPSKWRAWLDKNGAAIEGVWLKIAKKTARQKTVTYLEALDESLCYGWIDSQKASYDEHFFLQKFTPRRAKSIWSKVNVEKIAALTAAGKMKPAGLAAVEAAKQDGRWEQAYDSSTTMTMPRDFQEALKKSSKAQEFFATLNKTNTYAYLWRIQTAKKPETRQARIEKFVSMLERGEKIH